MAPLPRPGKLVAVGLNYYDHAREGGAEPPAEPMLFTKFTTSIVGPGATIEWDPALTASVDMEAELGVVIGRTARRVPEAEALSYVFGYTCINDVSARDLQKADRQFVRAKSLDTFGPMGPVIVTADEIPDPQRLAIRGILDGVADAGLEHVPDDLQRRPHRVLLLTRVHPRAGRRHRDRHTVGRPRLPEASGTTP